MPDTTEIDLRVFCDTKLYGKYDLTKPFVWFGWRYATDGHIAIRIPNGGTNTEGAFQKVEFVFDDFPICDQPLPAAVMTVIDCRRCGASGRVPGKCEMCGGPMEVCFVCSGAKRIMARKDAPRQGFPDGVVELAGGYFDPWYLYLIESRFQNVRHAAGVNEEKLCFVADGGVQIVLSELPVK